MNELEMEEKNTNHSHLECEQKPNRQIQAPTAFSTRILQEQGKNEDRFRHQINKHKVG
jgi:hypothetical protein